MYDRIWRRMLNIGRRDIFGRRFSRFRGTLKLNIKLDLKRGPVSELALQDLKSASMVALQRNMPFVDLLAENGVSHAPYNACLNDRPLIFQHIPKTGGASMGQVVETYFDDADICQAANPPDFEVIPQDREYLLFRGHVVAEQFRVFPKDAEFFTVLRDPVGYALSLYDWLLTVEAGLWDNTLSARSDLDSAQADRRGMERNSLTAADLVRKHSLSELLTLDSPNVELMFWSPYLRWLTRLRTPNAGKGRIAYLKDIRDDAENHYKSAVGHLSGAIALGDFGRLEEASLILCARRGWPAPPKLPSIHRKPRSVDTAVLASIEAAIRSASPYEFPLYELLSKRAAEDEATLSDAAGGSDAIRAHLDARYREKFFASAGETFGFHFAGGDAWGGCGWGVKERHIGDLPLRTIADGRSATLFARLDQRTAYIFLVEAFKADRYEDIEAVSVWVGEIPLVLVATNRTPRGQIQLVFDVPHDLVTRLDGRFEFRVEASATTAPGSLWFSSVFCQPRHY